MANFDRRPRGRNNNRRNGRRHNGPRTSQVIKLNDQGRSFNHQRPRFNGNASKLFEKYNVLAAEALSKDDKILAEHYFQHADHFTRVQSDQEKFRKMKNSENHLNASSNISKDDNKKDDLLENNIKDHDKTNKEFN